MSSYSRFASLLLGASVLFVCGCGQSGHELWKDTKSYYNRNLNPPATVDYDQQGFDEEAERRLADAFIEIDRQMHLLERQLYGVTRPTAEIVEGFLRQYPWIAGVAGIEPGGTIVAQTPEVSMKPMDYSQLVQHDEKQHMRDLRGQVIQTPLGPELAIAVPLYNSAEFAGLFAVHFDIRALLVYANSPQDIVILSPEAVLWPGRFDMETTPLHNADWNKLLRSSVSGSLSNGNGEFIWMSRFMGHEAIVFAVPVEGNFGEKPEQLAILDSLAALGNGLVPLTSKKDSSFAPVQAPTEASGQRGNFIIQ